MFHTFDLLYMLFVGKVHARGHALGLVWAVNTTTLRVGEAHPAIKGLQGRENIFSLEHLFSLMDMKSHVVVGGEGVGRSDERRPVPHPQKKWIALDTHE